MPEVRTPADWERIEVAYRAATRSLREIAAEHGITEGAIRKRAHRDGWERDLSAKVRAKADALVRKEAVRNEVRTETPTERETVEGEAAIQARVRISQRSDIARARRLCMALLIELEAQTGNLPELQELGEFLRSGDERGQDKLNDIYRAVIALPERTKTMKALADALKSLVGLEREAYGIDNAEPPPDPGALPPGMSLNDIARRIAYVLTAGLKEPA